MNEIKSKLKNCSVQEVHVIDLLLKMKGFFAGLLLNSMGYVYFKMTKESFEIIKEGNTNFTNFLMGSPDESFDFIHTDTVTDLQQGRKLDSFIQQLYRCLKRKGYVILKREVDGYNLVNAASEFFSLVDTPKTEVTSYKEVAVLYKP